MLFLVTVIRTVLPLFVGALVVGSYTSEAAAQVGQDGAGAGRAALCVMVVVLTLWATSLYRRAGLRRPWCFVGVFLLALLSSGTSITTGDDPVVGIGAGLTLLLLAYTVLAAETGWLTWRARRRARARTLPA